MAAGWARAIVQASETLVLALPAVPPLRTLQSMLSMLNSIESDAWIAPNSTAREDDHGPMSPCIYVQRTHWALVSIAGCRKRFSQALH